MKKLKFFKNWFTCTYTLDWVKKKFVALGIWASHQDKKKKFQLSKSCKSYSTFAMFHLKIPFLIWHKNMSYSEKNCHHFNKPCWKGINIVMMVKTVCSTNNEVWHPSWIISSPFFQLHTGWYCRILLDTLRNCRILLDTAGYCRIRPLMPGTWHSLVFLDFSCFFLFFLVLFGLSWFILVFLGFSQTHFNLQAHLQVSLVLFSQFAR